MPTNMWATCAIKFVAKNFQKLPNKEPMSQSNFRVA